jgi:hypothetical protein
MTSARRDPPRSTPTRRRPPGRQQLPVLRVFCEDLERGWIDHLYQHHRQVNIVWEGGLGVPASVVSRAVEATQPQDEVWVVVDRDEHDLSSALVRARDHHFGIIFSNPCFELWPILHLRDHQRREERDKLQHQLKSEHPGYDHDAGARCDWSVLCPGERDAVERAWRLHTRSPDDTTWVAPGRTSQGPQGAFANPTTTAWLLHIRCAEPHRLMSSEPDGLIHWLRQHPSMRVLVRCLPRQLRVAVSRALGE